MGEEYIKIKRQGRGFTLFEANGKRKSIQINDDFYVTINDSKSRPYVCLMTPKFYEKVYPSREDKVFVDYIRSLSKWGEIK